MFMERDEWRLPPVREHPAITLASDIPRQAGKRPRREAQFPVGLEGSWFNGSVYCTGQLWKESDPHGQEPGRSP